MPPVHTQSSCQAAAAGDRYARNAEPVYNSRLLSGNDRFRADDSRERRGQKRRKLERGYDDERSDMRFVSEEKVDIVIRK